MPARSKSPSDPGPAPARRTHLRAEGGFDAHLHLSRYWPDLARNSYGPKVEYSVPGLLAELHAAGVSDGLLLPPVETPGVAAAQSELAELARRSEGRLRFAATIDPTLAAGAWEQEFERLRTWGGISAIKLYPGYQPFYPHEPRLDRLYELARERRLPVLFHQGDTLHATARLRFARPVEVDEVAVRFPDVDLVLCHLGNPWIDEAAEVVYKNRRVHADISGLLAPPSSPYYREMTRIASERVQQAIWSVGSVGRFLYGSDWPLQSIAASVGIVRRLTLRPGDRAALLGGNARRLFADPAR